MDLSNINNRTSLAADTTKTYYLDLPIILKNQLILRDCIDSDLTVRIHFKKDIL